MDTAVAVDVGGTKLAVAVVDAAGQVLVRDQVPTPQSGVWNALEGLVGSVVGRSLSGGAGGVGGGGVAAPVVCGVGCGGPMSAGGETVSPLNIPDWRDFPLRAALAGLLGVPVFVDNDAKALALGEGWRGAAVGERDYIAMVVSTGVGGGIVLDGRLLDGASGNAGHIGHVVVVPGPDGRVCGCGVRGCLEAHISGRAVEALTGRPAAEASADVVERSGELLGRALGSVVSLLDLRLAVVSGSVALGWGAPFFDAARRSLAESCGLSFGQGARVVPGALGDAGPLVGAAAVAWRSLAPLSP